MNTIDVALICKALGDSNRLQIIQMLQPTLSHHMKILNECGLVNYRKEGRWHHYSLNCETLNTFKTFVEGLSCYKEESGGSQ